MSLAGKAARALRQQQAPMSEGAAGNTPPPEPEGAAGRIYTQTEYILYILAFGVLPANLWETAEEFILGVQNQML